MAYQLAENGSIKVVDNSKDSTAKSIVVGLPNGDRPTCDHKIKAITASGAGIAHDKMYK